MLIAYDYTEDVLKEKLLLLEEKTAINDNVHFAYGYCYVNNGDDIREAMKIADKRMYLNKKEFYNEHAEKKYR